MNHQKEEDIAVQRYPLNSEILAKLATMALSSPSMDSKQNLMFDVTCLGHFIGPRVSEYSKTSSKKVDRHKYPLGKKVIKAFTADDFVFFDKSGHTLELCDDSCLDQAHTVKITDHLAYPKEPSQWTEDNSLRRENMSQNMRCSCLWTNGTPGKTPGPTRLDASGVLLLQGTTCLLDG